MDRTLELAKFVEPPFRLLPEEKVSVWAGYKDIQEALLEIVDSPRSDRVGLYEFVVLHGALGTGKSHALRYLKYLITEARMDDFESIVVYVDRLKVATNTDFLALYRSIMRLLRPEMIRIGKVVDRVASEEVDKAWSELSQETKNLVRRESFPERQLPLIYAKMAPTFPALPRLLTAVRAGDDAAFAVLTGGKPRGVNPGKYDLDSFLDSEYEALRCLSALINMSTNSIGDEGRAIAKCFYLFIDEVETLRDFPLRNVQSINQGFRDLVNACPEHFCLMLGASADAAEIEAWLTDDVLSRRSRPPIELPELDVQQAVSFLKEVMKEFRVPGANVPDSFPFEDVALVEIATLTTERTPRSLFRNCQTVLRKAVLSGRLETQGVIKVADVQQYVV